MGEKTSLILHVPIPSWFEENNDYFGGVILSEENFMLFSYFDYSFFTEIRILDKMKKLLLINPVGQVSGYLLSKFSTIPPLSLAYVAAVTPSNWEVKVIDENFGRLEYEEADLVGISAFTSNINRAYEIAQIYRQRNIKVVIGEYMPRCYPMRFCSILTRW